MSEKKTPMKEQINADKDFTPTEHEDYGYFFFPERFGKVFTAPWYSFFQYSGSREVIKKSRCEENVREALQKHDGVKTLVSALKSAGCEPNLFRHFSCEHCDPAVKGGFDPSTNQSVICYNSASDFNSVANSMVESLLYAFDYCRANYDFKNMKHLACTQIIICHNNTYEYEDCSKILLHELVHAFDNCRANLDFNNSKHVACTEIRAANLTSCSIKDGLTNEAINFNFKDRRKECVRLQAAVSLQMVRNVSQEEALKIVDSVFDKCYNDMEPFGKPIRSYEDFKWVYANRFKYGYK